ncbi:MAG: PKD domain containing protein, partial [Odoribacter splanchnicus]
MVTGEHLQEPADQEVFFIAWGYRWNKTETFTGIDMLKAIAKNDPRLYVALSGNYIKGFGYDGNNDGKIELKSSTLHLTQADFTNGLYE